MARHFFEFGFEREPSWGNRVFDLSGFEKLMNLFHIFVILGSHFKLDEPRVNFLSVENYIFKKYLHHTPGAKPFSQMSLDRLAEISKKGLLILGIRNYYRPQVGHWVLLAKVDKKNSNIKIMDPSDANNGLIDIEVWQEEFSEVNRDLQDPRLPIPQFSNPRPFPQPIGYPPFVPQAYYAPQFAFPQPNMFYPQLRFFPYRAWGHSNDEAIPFSNYGGSQSLSVIMTGRPYSQRFISEILLIKPRTKSKRN